MADWSVEDEQIRCLLLTVAHAMVVHVDDVRIETYEEGSVITFELHVHPSDLRTLVGHKYTHAIVFSQHLVGNYQTSSFK